jgi:hypothetical protein
MEKQHGQAAGTYSMDMQREMWTSSIVKQQGYAAWTYSMETWTSSMDIDM